VPAAAVQQVRLHTAGTVTDSLQLACPPRVLIVVSCSLHTVVHYSLSCRDVNSQFTCQPAVAVGWLPRPLRIRKVPGASLGPETSYRVTFCAFPNFLLTAQPSRDRFLQRPFQVTIN
jgi:hypothetical protein